MEISFFVQFVAVWSFPLFGRVPTFENLTNIFKELFRVMFSFGQRLTTIPMLPKGHDIPVKNIEIITLGVSQTLDAQIF